MSKDQPRDRSLTFRVDGMTEREEQKMTQALVKAKQKLTGSEARASLLSGKTKGIGQQIKKSIEYDSDS
jgi:hypothetical protein